MPEPFDIFRISGGQPLWLKSEPALEDARAQIVQLAASRPGDYVIFNCKTGDKLSVRAAAEPSGG
jgi:hypothetical protein